MVDLWLRDTSAAASTAKEKVKVFWDDGLIVTVVQTLIHIHIHIHQRRLEGSNVAFGGSESLALVSIKRLSYKPCRLRVCAVPFLDKDETTAKSEAEHEKMKKETSTSTTFVSPLSVY
jgi:hypothetical protein